MLSLIVIDVLLLQLLFIIWVFITFGRSPSLLAFFLKSRLVSHLLFGSGEKSNIVGKVDFVCLLPQCLLDTVTLSMS